MSVRDRLGHAAGTSRLASALESFGSGSRVVGAVDRRLSGEYGDVVRSWRAGASSLAVLEAVGRRLSRIAGGAATLDVLGTVGDWVRSSLLYRWLTAEPEPEVIVIDLRETLTVRPVLITIDESIGLLLVGRRTSIVRSTVEDALGSVRDAPIRVMSYLALVAILVSVGIGVARGTVEATGVWIRLVLAALALAGTRLEYSWETIRDSRPARLAVALLEPPEPPESPGTAGPGRRDADREQGGGRGDRRERRDCRDDEHAR